MRDKIQVLLKSLLPEMNSLDKLWKFMSTTIGYISSIFTFAVLLKNLTSFDKAEALCKSHWKWLILIGIIVSLICNREKTSYKGTIEDDDLQIEIRISDLFSIKASSYVIPTNTFFRTVMKGEYISSESVQGAFQLKYFKKNTAELDKLIAKSLERQGIEGKVCSDIYGSVKQYPIGTVAKVDYKKKHYYFVAINDVNEYGKPINQEYTNVDIALNGLMKAINKFGHCDNLAMPLIGTGRAAIREATLEENIIDRFVKSHDKIARQLIISLRPKDYLDGKIKLKKIKKYIEYKCEFK